MRLAQMKIMNALSPVQIMQIPLESTVGHVEFDTNHSWWLSTLIGNNGNSRGNHSAVGVIQFVHFLRQLLAVDVAEGDHFLLVVFRQAFVELPALLASVPDGNLIPVVEDVLLEFSYSKIPNSFLADTEGGRCGMIAIDH